MRRSDIRPGAVIRSSYQNKTVRRIVSVGATHAKVAPVSGKTEYKLDLSAIERYWELEAAK